MNSPALPALAFLILTAACNAAEYFVAVAGSAKGDGSEAAPWDLATALASPPLVKPGDTITLAPGTYRGGFKSTLNGEDGKPVTVRSRPGAMALIDSRPRDARDSGLFLVQGAWCVFRDLEFTCSDPKRETKEKGSWPAEIRRGGIDVHGAHHKFVNLLVHDRSNGFGFWGKDASEAGGEIYGCIIYYNGWLGPDRGHGHAIYSQNAVGSKRIADNIVFDQFGSGIHVYGSEKSALRGYRVEGNICFNNGSLAGSGQRGTDLLIGGLAPVENATVRQNYTYGGGGVRFGYVWGPENPAIEVRENYIVGPLSVSYVQRPSIAQNTIIAPGTLGSLDLREGGLVSAQGWRQNTYIRTKTEYAAFNVVENKRARGLKFPEWQAQLGLDEGSTYTEGAAKGIQVFVRRNEYQKGRGHLAVYNWDRAETIDADLSAVLAKGQRYRVVRARDFHGAPVASGVYDGAPVRLPMEPAPGTPPVDTREFRPPVDAPIFDAFVVLPD